MKANREKKLPMNYVLGGVALLAVVLIAWKISK